MRGNNNYPALNVSAPKFIKFTRMDLKSHKDPNTVVLGDLIPLSPVEHPHTQKKNHQRNSRIEWQHRSNGPDRWFHPATAQYTFFSATHGTLSKIDHIIGHNKVSTNIRKLKSVLHTVWQQNNKSRTQKQKKHQKILKQLELNNTLLNGQWVI
jgi:hypothetical protein